MTTVVKSLRTWNRYFYKCRCGASDSNTILGNEKPPLVMNCYKCRGGYGKNPAEQIAGKVGQQLTDREPESWGEASIS